MACIGKTGVVIFIANRPKNEVAKINEKQSSIAKDLEQLFKKTVEANQLFLSEGARFVKNLSASTLKGEDLVSGQKELINDTFNQFVKLNIQYASNLVDMGIALSQKMSRPFDVKPEAHSAPDNPSRAAAGDKPAFVLNVSGSPDTRITTQFLLDSDKKDPVLCHLIHTGYRSQQDAAKEASFETVFLPQSFQLFFGEPQKVTIEIKLPADAKEGVYLSNVRVEGFGNTFFSLYVQVIPPNDSSNKSSA
jgi:hypothetical protein